MADFGMMCGEMSPTFLPTSRMTTAARPTSLPVPAVVGIAIKGLTEPVILFIPCSMAAKVRNGPEWVAAIDTPLPRSMEDPPPSAMMPSHFSAVNRIAAVLIACSVGLAVSRQLL